MNITKIAALAGIAATLGLGLGACGSSPARPVVCGAHGVCASSTPATVKPVAASHQVATPAPCSNDVNSPLPYC